MKKLNKVFRINPLYQADGYKVGHKAMLAPNTSREYWTWIPRSLKFMHPSITRIMSAGQQLTVRYIHSIFQEEFFEKPVDVAVKFTQDMSKYLGMEFDGDHFEELHSLGYLPIKIKALPEGLLVNPNIPHMTGINTVDGYAWLGLYLETLISKLSWQMPTAATIGYQFKKNSVEWVKKTDVENLWLADFMNHDFHSRGGNPFSSIAVGLGHALSNLGSDTLDVIPASRYYYDFSEQEVPIFSVNASEHSVTCTGIFYYQKMLREGKFDDRIEEYYDFDAPCEGDIDNPDYLAISEWLNLEDWLERFPQGILSYVCDTFNTWKLITYVLPRLKDLILARSGKLVVRPDTGDPVDILCGEWQPRDNAKTAVSRNIDFGGDVKPEHIGVIELLWDIFGGTVNGQGYKVLDPHIGAIYGDSINLERQVQIYERLAAKSFAATNTVLGVGSYTYIMLTRDSAGWAAKGAWFETLENGERTAFNIYKDPFTGDGSKKSLKGFIAVHQEGDNYVAKQECTVEEENEGLLQVIYQDGEFLNQTTLEEIRTKLAK